VPQTGQIWQLVAPATEGAATDEEFIRVRVTAVRWSGHDYDCGGGVWIHCVREHGW